MHADSVFKSLCKETTALGINLKCASKIEYVPKIERFIRTVKERARSARATITFKRISMLMIVNNSTSAILWIHVFTPSKPGAGISDTKCPRQLFLGNMVNYKKFCRLQSREYVQLHQEDETCNTIFIDWTVGSIVLRHQYNLQGGYF